MAIRKGVLKGHLFGTVSIRNIFYADITLGEGDTYISAFSDYLSQILTAIRPCMATGWTIETLEIFEKIGSSWYPQTEQAFTWTGTGSGDQLANAVAAVLIGVVANQKGHGRKFLSGMTEASVNGNSLAGSAVAAFASACAYYIAPYTTPNGGAVVPGIYTKGGIFHSFTNGFVSSLLGSMRRRKPGNGI